MNNKKILINLLLLFSVVGYAVVPHRPGSSFFIWGNGGAQVEVQYEVSGTDGMMIYDGTDFSFSQPLDVTGTIASSGEVTSSGDNLTIGDGTNTDKKYVYDVGLGAANPFFLWDSAANILSFSNDGVISKPFGTGSGGGGQNFFSDKNPDAESGTNNFTNTGGGTFSTFSVAPINSLNSFRWDASAQNDVLRTDQVDIPEKFKGQACQIEFTYTGGTDDLTKPQVVDSSNVKLVGATYQNQDDKTDFLKAQTGIVTRSIFFLCPTTGTIAFEFNQTAVGNPAVMDFDDVHIGENLGLGQSVLPDVLSARASSTGVIQSESVDFIQGDCTNASPSVCTFIGGIFTVTPSCVPVTEDVGSNSGIHILATSSTSVSIQTTAADVATQRAFAFVCTKQIPDSQQSVQVFTSIPKVSENINEVSATIAANGVVTLENSDWITGDCTNASPRVCTLALTLSSALNCSTDQEAVTASSTTSISIAGNTNISRITCQKSLTDFKLPTVQPILVNQVETSIMTGVTIEACEVTNNAGVPINGNALCNTWVSGYTDTALGVWTVNIIPGTFSDTPVCSCTATDPGVCSFNPAPTVTTIPLTIAVITTGNAFDAGLFIQCTGKR